MYASRDYRASGARPGSLGASLLLTGAMIAGLILASPHVRGPDPATVLTIANIPIPPPPPPEPVKPIAKTTSPQPLVAPRPAVPPPPRPDTTIAIDLPPLPPLPPMPKAEPGPVVLPSPAPSLTPAPPVLVGPQVDPRYADALQPPYPPEERRAEHEGRAVVRVLIGVDGRVKQVEKVSATSDAFFRVTQAQALRAWRFKPATRDGVPVEGWRTMAIRFVLQDG